jgi:hypothetical protein
MGGADKNIAGPSPQVDLAPFNPLAAALIRADLAAVQTLARPNTNPPPTKLLVQAFDQNIRFTLYGELPLPAFGFRITATNDPIMITLGPNTVVRVVEEAATATLMYCWGC